MYRLITARVIVRDDGIRVVNLFRTVDLTWSDVERFVLDKYGMHKSVGIAFLRDEEEPVMLYGIRGAEGWSTRRTEGAQKLIDQLEARRVKEVGECRPTTSSTASPST
jgi:hypothetical protein